MPEISVTDEQLERLKDVREDVEAAFTDKYGRTHLEDAIDYLLDTYTPPNERESEHSHEIIATADYSLLQNVATDVSGVPGSGINADELRGQLISELGVTECADRLLAAQVDSDEEPPRSADQPSGQYHSTEETPAVEQQSSNEAVAPTEQNTDDTLSSTDEAEPGGDSSGLLSAANMLLEEYQSKWSRNRTGDEPYVVELPDGTTVSARTKDDVRQILFQHYD